MSPSATTDIEPITNGLTNGVSNGITPSSTNGTITPTPNGTKGFMEFSYPIATAPEGPYTVLPQYHSQPSKIRVAGIGAGATGLCLAYKMERMLEPGSFELTLFEKNPFFGGTWHENTYPGVACDIPSHLYTYTFEPNPDWSHYFAYGPEIKQYFERFADKYNTHRYMRLSTKVVEAQWSEEAGIWNIIVEDQITKELSKDWAHVVVNGTGILNNWKWPVIDGLHDFKGALMHSAKWDHSVDFKGKTVGVIGNGSTAVQIVPEMQKVGKTVKVFMRSSTWISPPFGGGVLKKHLKKDADEHPGDRQYTFTKEDKAKFNNDPEYHLQFRKEIESEINSLFGMYFKGSETSELFRENIRAEMLRRMGPGHEELKKNIIPTWAPGCRRISPGDGYLEALVKDNVEYTFSGIEKVVPEGIVTKDGKTHKMDILVCATGFQVAFKPAFKMINGEGHSIDEDWKNGPNLYFGLSAPRFPNYYTIVGPGATWSNGTLLPSIENSVEYSVKMIRKMQTDLIKSMDLKQEVLDDIYAHFDEFHKTTVWGEDCRSWFKDGKIKNRIYLWPGPTIHFVKTIKDPRFEDYNIKYRYKNRFAFLGGGQVKAHVTNDAMGLATYVRGSDYEWSVE